MSKPTPIRVAGKGRAWKKNGINVLHLRGNHAEMSGQHGALLREEILQGAVPFLGKKNDSLVEHSYIFRNRPVARAAFLGILHGLQRPMQAYIPRSYKEESFAMARATGLPWSLVEQTSLQADSLVLMMRYSMGRFLIRELGRSPRFTGIPGCTSVVALKEHTQTGGLLHARNMDYPAIGHWDSHPAVFYCDPDEGQRTVGITTAGVHTTGVTAVNESGITLSAHFHCSKAVSLFGTPIHIIGSEMMRRAKTLGQAIDIVSTLERAGSWSFVVSSAKENRAVVIEMVHGDMVIRDANDTNGMLVNTNMFRSPTLQKSEILISASAALDFEHRYQRALELLEGYAKNEGVSVRSCARILADHYDREIGTLRSQSNTISVVTTVTSLVSDLANNRFWVANATESPVCLGNYSAFSLNENFEGFENRELPAMDWSQAGDGLGAAAEQNTIRGTRKHDAFKYFRKAYIAFHNRHDIEETVHQLERATKIDAEEANYWIALGHMLMRLKRNEEALHAFQRAGKCRLGDHMAQTLRLFTAHAYDTLGRRDEALKIYQDLDHELTVSPHVRAEARKCVKRAYKNGQAENITFDFQYCDSFEYP